MRRLRTAARVGLCNRPFRAAEDRKPLMLRPPYSQLQQILADDELPGKILLRRGEFLGSRVAGDDVIEQ